MFIEGGTDYKCNNNINNNNYYYLPKKKHTSGLLGKLLLALSMKLRYVHTYIPTHHIPSEYVRSYILPRS